LLLSLDLFLMRAKLKLWMPISFSFEMHKYNIVKLMIVSSSL
jgi:hypothetical protein